MTHLNQMKIGIPTIPTTFLLSRKDGRSDDPSFRLHNSITALRQTAGWRTVTGNQIGLGAKQE